MGDAADLAFEALENGQSIIWNELSEEIELRDNIELMNSTMHGLMYLDECSIPLMQYIIQKYGIEVLDENDLAYCIRMHFDP